MIHSRTKIIALISISLFLVSLAAFGGVTYLLKKHKSTLEQERIALADAEMQKKSLQDLLSIVESSGEEREKMRGYILDDERIIDLLTLIGTLSKEQGAIYSTSNLVVSPIDDTFETLAFTVSIEGSFEKIMRVLSILEALPQQSIISEVLFTKTVEKESASNEWQGTIDIQVTKYKSI